LAGGTKEEGAGGEKPAAEEKPITVKISAFGSPTSPNVTTGEYMAEYIKDKTDGKIQVQIFPGATLSSGKQKGSIEQTQIGTIEGVLSDVALFTPWEEKLSVLSLPFLFDSHATMHAFSKTDTCKEVAGMLEAKGLKIAGVWSRLPRQFCNTKRQVKTVKDLNGLKIRVPGSKVYTTIWEALGANPTPMAWGEVFTSLQLGTIDGVEQPVTIVISSGIYEVIKHITMSNYLTGFVFVTYNKDFFDGLKPEYQKILIEAAEAANEYKHKNDVALIDESLEKIKEEGINVYYPTDSELQAFKDATSSVWDDYRSIIGEDLMDRVTTTINEIQ